MRKILLLALSTVTLLTACDEGRIEETTQTVARSGRVVKLTGDFSGLDRWPSGYNVVLAGFEDDSEYAVISKGVQATLASGDGESVVLDGIGSDVTSIRLCAINRLRECIVTFASVEDEASLTSTDTIRLDVGEMNVSMYAAVQTGIFDAKCVACHGQNGSAPRGLFLTEELSYASLVNQPSLVDTEMLLVNPGNSDESFLYKVVTENGYVSMTHVDMFSQSDASLLTLLKSWIDNGATE